MKPEWSQGFFSYPSTRLYQQNPNGYSYEVARTDNDIRWVVTLIRDNRCDQEDNLECQIESVRKYVLGKKRHRNQAISLGMVEALASCLRTAPSKLHRVILQALHEVTTDLEYYPANINDTFFITLASQLIEHPECIRGTLGILCEFTKFDQGKNSAHNAKVAKTLGEVLSSARHNDVLVPTLQVLYNIAEVPTYAGTLVDARIFESFQTVIEERLVEYFQKQMVTDLDDQAAPLMWNIVMTNNKPVREKLVHQVTSECFNYCSRVLDGWSPVMTQWAKVMRLCVNNSEVLEQVKKNFVLNSLVVLRYGESDCVVPLIDTLYNVSSYLSEKDKVFMINEKIVDTLLGRYSVETMWKTLTKDIEASLYGGASTMPNATIRNILLLIANLLKALPRDRVPTTHSNNVVATLQSHRIGELCTLAGGSNPINEMLIELFTIIDYLAPGWCAYSSERAVRTQKSLRRSSS